MLNSSICKFIVLSFLFSSFSFSQTVNDSLLEVEKEQTLKWQNGVKAGNDWKVAWSEQVDINNSLWNSILNEKSKSTLTIPLVFHIYHLEDSEIGEDDNISYAQILSAYYSLRWAFKEYTAESFVPTNDPDGVGVSSHPNSSVDLNVDFCLAQRYKPVGEDNYVPLDTPGVLRYEIEQQMENAGLDSTGVIQTDLVFDNLIKPQSIQDPSSFINVWVIENKIHHMPYGLARFPHFPPGSTGLPGLTEDTWADGLSTIHIAQEQTDGVMLRQSVLGSNLHNLDNQTYVTYPEPSRFAEGDLMAHEIGHNLGLFHTFGANGSCESDDPVAGYTLGDYCDDTPDQKGAFVYDSISENPDQFLAAQCEQGEIRVDTFMNYTWDNLKNKFTDCQKNRMKHTLLHAEWKKDLINSNACEPINITGVYESNQINSNQINLFPNPLSIQSGEFSLSVLDDSLIGKEAMITLVSINGGNLIIAKNYKLNSMNTFKLSSHLAAGNYFLILEFKNGQLGKFQMALVN